MNAEVFEFDRNGVRIEHTQNHRFAVWPGQKRGTHFDFGGIEFDGETSVLGFLDHIQFQFADQLDAGEQKAVCFGVEMKNVGEHAVEAVAQTHIRLFRFEMDIGGFERDRPGKNDFEDFGNAVGTFERQHTFNQLFGVGERTDRLGNL